MAQANFTPISLYFSTTVAAIPTAGNLVNGELAINITDGKLYFKNNSGVVTLLASAAGSSGDVVGPASSTDNALARFDSTTGKLIQNSVGILSDAGVLTGLTGLTSSGAITLSGGTANGVAYLNGSKVLTTGSALTFAGTQLGINGANANILFDNGGVGGSALQLGTSGTSHGYIGTAGSFPLLLQVNGIEAMRIGVASGGVRSVGIGYTSLTSVGDNGLAVLGNVGIGTSSPAGNLNVNTTGNTQVTISAGNTGLSRLVFQGQVSNNRGFIDYDNTSSVRSFIFRTNEAEAMRLDSAGNLGLGVAPSASWLGKAFEINGVGNAIWSPNAINDIRVVSNTKYNAGVQYAADGYANGYYCGGTNGTHAWQNAPSGTAGDPITFTQAMTLSAAGDLGVGVTSPGARVDVRGSATDFAGLNVINSESSSGVQTTASIRLGITNSIGVRNTRITAIENNTDSNSVNLAFFTNEANALNSEVERARITAEGNLLVGGTSSVIGKLEVSVTDTSATADGINIRGTQNSAYGGYLSWSDTWIGDAYRGKIAAVLGYRVAGGTGSLRFFTASGGALNEVGRFDQNGNLLVGTTSSSGRLTIQKAGGAADAIYVAADSGGAGYSFAGSASTATPAYFSTSSGAAGSITCSGTTTAYNTSSDYRLKNITGPITTSGAYIDSLNPVEGTWKADGSTFVGLIAHEVQEASRTPVATGVKDGEEMQGMDYSNAELIANLIAEVKALRTRVAALESI
jgi:hypothetical protein